MAKRGRPFQSTTHEMAEDARAVLMEFESRWTERIRQIGRPKPDMVRGPSTLAMIEYDLPQDYSIERRR